MIKSPAIRQPTRTDALLEDVVRFIGGPVSTRTFRRDGHKAVNYEWPCGCFGTLPQMGAQVAWNQCPSHHAMLRVGPPLSKALPPR